MQNTNKKVKNATKVEVDGIKFRSKLEAYTYKKLKDANIPAEYETYRYELLPSFLYNNKKIRAILLFLLRLLDFLFLTFLTSFNITAPLYRHRVFSDYPQKTDSLFLYDKYR